jgi:hypothetical protein
MPMVTNNRRTGRSEPESPKVSFGERLAQHAA